MVDLNRPPDDTPLYESAGTGLVPLETFDGEAIYLDGAEPDQAERDARLDRYWRPYHEILADELQRLKGLHGHVTLLDAHSIRSVVPRLFEGRLADLNLGSHGGVSADPGLVRTAFEQVQEWRGFSSVLDGRFRGGYITRHYGDPANGVHVLQMEMAQSVYMQEDPPRCLPDRLARTRRLANGFIQKLLAWKPPDD